MSLPRRRSRGSLKILILGGFLLSLFGCHSASVTATVANRTAKPISLIQIDYPSASFGTQLLNPGQEFKYRFKVLGSGEVKLSFTDDLNRDHKSVGPILNEHSEGVLAITVTDKGVVWQPGLTATK